MKKITAIALVLVMMLSIAACAPTTENPADSTPETPASTAMTHAEFLAAANNDPVEVEAYVQATQSWWDNKIVVYAMDKSFGGYIAYNLTCTEDDAAKLTPGTKINIKGYKTFYKGMPEIAEGATFTVVEGADTFVAPAEIMTNLLGKKELLDKVGALGAFQGLTVKSITYKNDAPGDDIYVSFTLGDATYDFCVERYLTDPETDVYKAFVNGEVKVGDVVDVQGFVYWYDADAADGVASENAAKVNTHITKITVVG